MRTGSRRLGRVLVLSVSLILVAMVTMVQARPQTGAAISLDDDDIGGVVSSNRPEAGVWVIAETTDLPTPYRKIVVTDDEGRYLVPDLPDARYQVWVRGYGLVDSPRVQAAPGETLNLTAVVAPDPGAAAEYYPANYWYALLEPPSEREFTPEGRETSGIAPGISSYQEFLGRIRTTSCGQCHQMGNKVTREMPKNMGTFDSTVAAWSRRVESGQAGAFMSNLVTQLGRSRALEMWADWTDRVMAGELPPVPPRPSGLERNLVITQWDWADETSYVHDEISTDKRNPTVNAYGPIFGAEQFASETVHMLDPGTHVASTIPLPARDADRMRPQWAQAVLQPSPNWGEALIWTARADTHNPMMDHKGRTWFTAIIRPPEDQPDWCKEGSDHPSAKVLPREQVDIPVGPGTPWARRGRQLAVYDPATQEFTAVDTCGNGNHLQFAEDENHTLWTGSSWFSVKIWDETGDSSKAAGWLNYVRDANGNGQRDEYVGIDDPMDPTKDKEISGGAYGLITSPVDGALWSSINRFPGELIRVDPGPNPAETALAEVFEPPLVDPADPSKGYQGYTPRGIDIDRHGVVWTGLSGERAPGQFRPAQVHGAAQRARGDGAALSGRLDALPLAGAELQGGHGGGHDRRALLQLGRSAQHVGARCERAVPDRQQFRFADRARGWRVGRVACALPLGLLHEGHGRPDRRTRTPAGRAGGCGPLSAPSGAGTPKAARVRQARSRTSRCGPIRWPSDGPILSQPFTAPSARRTLRVSSPLATSRGVWPLRFLTSSRAPRSTSRRITKGWFCMAAPCRAVCPAALAAFTTPPRSSASVTAATARGSSGMPDQRQPVAAVECGQLRGNSGRGHQCVVPSSIGSRYRRRRQTVSA